MSKRNDPPDRLIVNGRRIRAAHRYPGGPPVGHVVTAGGRLIAWVRADGELSLLATLAMAVRFAQGDPTYRDKTRSINGLTKNPQWFAHAQRVPVIGRVRKRDDRIVFDPRCGLATRPARTSVAHLCRAAMGGSHAH